MVCRVVCILACFGSTLPLASCATPHARPANTFTDQNEHGARHRVRASESVSPRSDTACPVNDATRLHRAYTLENWDDGGEVSHFVYAHLSQFFPTAVIHRRGPVSELEYDLDPSIGRFVVEKKNGRALTLDAYLDIAPIDGLVILHRGKIVYERYPRMRSRDKHILFSVTKAFIGTLVGILEDRGLIDVNRAIDEYISELRNTAWEGVGILDILDMSSGMAGHEIGAPYTDPAHKHYQMEASLGWLPKTDAMPQPVIEDDTYAFLTTLERRRAPGTRREYASINTTMLGWLIERVTGKPIATVLSDEIWSHMGAESDAMIVVNRHGIPVAHGGMTMTLRDLARFGLLFTEHWRLVSDKRIISDAHLHGILDGGRSHLLGNKHPAWMRHATRQWDGVTDGGSFYKDGYGHQFLWIAPRNAVVIAYFGTNEALKSSHAVELPIRQMTDTLFPKQ